MKLLDDMIHKSTSDIAPFLAGDHTLLKEILHPKNDCTSLPFSLAHASLEQGEQSLPHRLGESETYYFLAGSGSIFIENKEYRIKVGHLIIVPPKALQHVSNTGTGKMEFLCIVSPPWNSETEEIISGGD